MSEDKTEDRKAFAAAVSTAESNYRRMVREEIKLAYRYADMLRDAVSLLGKSLDSNAIDASTAKEMLEEWWGRYLRR